MVAQQQLPRLQQDLGGAPVEALDHQRPGLRIVADVRDAAHDVLHVVQVHGQGVAGLVDADAVRSARLQRLAHPRLEERLHVALHLRLDPLPVHVEGRAAAPEELVLRPRPSAAEPAVQGLAQERLRCPRRGHDLATNRANLTTSGFPIIND